MPFAKGGVKVLIKSKPDDFWEKIKESTLAFPVAADEIYLSIKQESHNLRKVEYGRNSHNIKSSTEQITNDGSKTFEYDVTEGDILSKYYAEDFKVTIKYPIDSWVEWNWSYNYPSAQKASALLLDVEFAMLATETIAKLDKSMQLLL